MSSKETQNADALVFAYAFKSAIKVQLKHYYTRNIVLLSTSHYKRGGGNIKFRVIKREKINFIRVN